MRRLVIHRPDMWEPSEIVATPPVRRPVRLRGGFGRLVPRSDREARLTACATCPRWHPEPRWGLGHCGLCRVCGGTRVHAWAWASRCALNLWPQKSHGENRG